VLTVASTIFGAIQAIGVLHAWPKSVFAKGPYNGV
jgi:hypothetical protein